MRYKTIYILNAAPAVESLITLAKSFVRKDLVKKVSEKLNNILKCGYFTISSIQYRR